MERHGRPQEELEEFQLVTKLHWGIYGLEAVVKDAEPE
jgi:hypothetical protein